MTIDFNKLIEFNNKHPDSGIGIHQFIFLNMVISEEISESFMESYMKTFGDTAYLNFHINLESSGILKITGDSLKDVSIRDLGLELIGQSKSDSIIELAEKIREMFPKGVKSGGYPVRSSTVDIADKLRKFFKKHKYTQEQVLEATKRYVERKGREGYSYMQKAVFFIEKDGSSTLAAECDNLKDESTAPKNMELTKML